MSEANFLQVIKTQFEKPEFKTRFLELVKDETTFRREIAFATMAIAGSEMLQKCTQESIMRAVFNVATTGMSLSPVLKFAALTPRYINGKYEAVLFPMYQGLVKLVTDTKCAKSIRTHLVYDGDQFEVELGDEYKILHKPKFLSTQISHVYSIATLTNGEKIIEYMTTEEVERARESSDSWRAYKAGRLKAEHCIWIQHEPEMFRKTVLRRIIKYIPKTDAYTQNSKILELDESDTPASFGKIGYLESLLQTSTFDDETRKRFENILQHPEDISNAEADMMAETLLKNQQMDLKKKLAHEMKNERS